MITRTFHPIGQGAFYSEQIGDKTIVYDCGVWDRNPDKINASQVVKNAFPSDHKIDLLFISHFDYDHVSLVPLLLELFDVNKIVIPLLDPIERELIARLLVATDLSRIANLALNPAAFAADEKISVIQIDVGDIPNVDSPPPDLPPFELEEEITNKITTIKSGRPINIPYKLGLDWVCVPFNYKAASRGPELEKVFNKEGIAREKLIDPDYFESNRNNIKKAYKTIKGNINQNSLFLYSGLSTRALVSHYRIRPYGYYCRFPYIHARPSCIYTGDGNLNIVDIKLVYKKFWEFVGTIQIPHHGSKLDFKPDTFLRGKYICPISYGCKNLYGHPNGDVLKSLLENKNYPVLVNENDYSETQFFWSLRPLRV